MKAEYSAINGESNCNEKANNHRSISINVSDSSEDSSGGQSCKWDKNCFPADKEQIGEKTGNHISFATENTARQNQGRCIRSLAS